ncbi:MAG: hypothetical protein ACQEQS_01845 [Thermodesulfobacteriota bacterium]
MESLKESEHIAKIAKDVVNSIWQDTYENCDDGTGYVKSVKSIIDGLNSYIGKDNSGSDLKKVPDQIYKYSKDIWVNDLTKNCINKNNKDKRFKKKEALYYEFCFKYIFDKGEFPL